MAPKKHNLKLTAYEYIKQRIIDGTLRPGQDIVEEELRKELGSSRTPVREAIMRLQNEDLIEIYPRKGMFVSNITVKMVNNIYQVREIIEPQSIRIGSADLSKDVLELFMKKFKDTPSLKGEKLQEYYTNLDRDFHSYIISASRNDYLVKIMNNILNQSQRIRIQSFNIKNRYVMSNKEHVVILKALIDNKIDEAMILMQKHIANSKNVALNIISKYD
jgi:GntR family transcriptional regulator, rspAB operon transcriptional repressor